jgi:hypothetical protein
MVLATFSADAEPLSRVEISKRGKAATAYLRATPYSAIGAACCIHPSGIFLTSHSALPSDQGPRPFTLVLNPGQRNQRKLMARLLRRSANLNLALLRAEGAENLPALVPATKQELTEPMELIAFGFPPSGSASPDETETPAITVSVGRVTKLPREKGRLLPYLLDTGTRRADTGGPVLDTEGQLVGVIQIGPGGGTTSFVTPLDDIRQFLSPPEIAFTPPAVAREALAQPVAFAARAESFIPADQPLALTLTLKAGDSTERRYPMELRDGVYRATAPPVAAVNGAVALRFHATFSTDAVNGSVADQAFRLGGRELRLRQVRDLWPRPEPRAVLREGETVRGTLDGLAEVSARVGSEAFPLNLARADVIHFESPDDLSTVACAIVASRAGKEVGRQETALRLTGTAGPPSRQASEPAIQPPVFTGKMVVRQLPGTVADVVVGGGGRYLILALRDVRKVAIFDVNEGAVVRTLDVPASNFLIAAGRDKLLIGLPTNLVVQRWSLTSFEREAAVRLPVEWEMRQFAMGSNSDGPLLAAGALFDLHTLKKLDIEARPDDAPLPNESNLRLRVSGDGKVFGYTQTDSSPSGFNTLMLSGRKLLEDHRNEQVGYVVPGPDGRVIYTQFGLRTVNGGSIPGSASGTGESFLPAVRGPYYLGLGARDDTIKGHIVYVLGDDRPVVRFDDIDLGRDILSEGRNELGGEKRIHFIPEAKLLVVIPRRGDHLVLHRTDIDAALDASGTDYLFVTSQPPATIAPGETFRYALTVKSRRGGIKYRLEAGPSGMTVSPTGRVTWDVPAAPDYSDVDVVVAARDGSGQEHLHAFRLAVGAGGPEQSPAKRGRRRSG